MTPSLICATLEVALNRTLRLEPEVLADLAPQIGKVLAFEVTGFDWLLAVEPITGGVRVLPEAPAAPVVTLSASPVGYLALARLLAQGGDSRSLPEGVSVRGDAEQLHRFTQLLVRVNFDPEEVLARYTGNAAAHRLMGALKGVLGWGRKTADTLALDTAEYLREETYSLARGRDVADWTAAVETLRDDSDRLEARLRRLEAARAPQT